MNTKQQQLLFDKGITNVPSDILCSDNALEESMGLVYEDGEHRVIQKPKELASFGSSQEDYRLLYVHKIGSKSIYIYLFSSAIRYGEETEGSISMSAQIIMSYSGNVEDLNITSIGRTLIISSQTGITYSIWEGDASEYKVIGSEIPDLGVTFSMGGFGNNRGSTDFTYTEPYISMNGMLDGKIIHTDTTTQPGFELSVAGNFFKEGKYEDAKTALIGLTAMRINQVHENKRFVFPFWVRYAIKLYDGTYTHISNPVLMFPTVGHNCDIYVSRDDTDSTTGAIPGDHKYMNGSAGEWSQTNYRPYYAKLYYQLTAPNDFDASQWEDIISGIDIFVSEEVKTFDMEGTWTIQNCYDLPYDTFPSGQTTPNPLFTAEGRGTAADYCSPAYQKAAQYPIVDITDETTFKTFYRPAELTEEEIIDALLDKSTFYQIVELELEAFEDTTVTDATDKIKRGALLNLTTQTQLPNDDYFSRATIKADIIKAYNSRLHLASVKRGFFEGFSQFSFTQLTGVTDITLYYYIYIRTETGVRVVRKATAVGNVCEIGDIWYYYPDPRAFKVEIYYESEGTKYRLYSLTLQEHPSLNGAYTLGRLPGASETMPAGVVVEEWPDIVNNEEELDEHLYVSEADNPFVFNASGDYTIRMGGIVGLASQTMALNELEHGIHPLTVFSKKGISMMRLKDEGTYLRSDDISREVCSNPKSITETDGPVFFASDKGLMMIVGQQVKCVSEQLSGKSDNPFQRYLETAFIAYDYRDSLLWIFDGTTRYCYIYSIKSGTFSRFDFGEGNIVTTAVNNYPDYLLQTGDEIYTLTGRDNINDDEATDYAGRIVTRPLKLENGLALKSLMQMKNIMMMNDNAALAMTIEGSNTAKTWTTLNSLRGMPWKYYRFTYQFTGMKATDRFAGTVLITQERRTNKLR